MTDYIRNNRLGDDTSIDVGNSVVVSYWANTLGVTKTNLRRAVIHVGPLVKDVKNWLRKNRHIK